MMKSSSCLVSIAVVLVLLLGSLTGCLCAPLLPFLPSLPTPEPGPTRTPAVGPTSVRGDLNLYDTGPITLDPALSAEMSSHTYVMQIFSGLVGFDDSLRPAPDIADRWEKSADGKTYTFYLRKSVKFHSGREVKAADFKYSWERACDPATGSMTAGTYLNDIVGAKEMLAGKARELSGVKVIDDYTLQVTIDAPKAYFLSKMTYSTAMVVDRSNVASGREWWRKPVGTGPFKLRDWQQDKLVTLERNGDYYGKPAGVSRVVFKLFGGVPMNLYELGEIDVTQVSQNDIERARDKSGPFASQLSTTAELSLYYVGFNATTPPFDDANVRRAFSHGIDKQRLIDLTQYGMVRKAEGFLPPGMPGYNAGVKGLDFNVATAKSLLASSKYAGKLPPVAITVSGWGGQMPDYVGALVQQWRENLGVEVMVRQLEPDSFFYTLRREKDQMYASGWVADYPDPQNFLQLLFRTGEENNVGEFSNAGIDALLDKAAVEQNEAVRFKMYQEIEQALVDQAATLPLWFNVTYLLTQPYVKDYKVSALGIPVLSQVKVQR